MIKKLNKDIKDFISWVTDDSKIDWAECNITETYYKRNELSYALIWYGDKDYVLEAIKTYDAFTRGPSAISIMKVLPSETGYNGVKESWWDLQILDMSPNVPNPALTIRAKDFNIYEIETEKDEEGNIKDRPNLADFIKWKKEQEESKEMVNK